MPVKPAEQMDNQTLLMHLNRRHAPFPTLRPPDSELTFVPNMTDSLAKVWKAWHAREHRNGQSTGEAHEHVG